MAEWLVPLVVCLFVFEVGFWMGRLIGRSD